MKAGLISQLRWTKMGTAPQALTEAFALPPEPRPQTSTAIALDMYGLPEVPPEYQASPLTETHFLLKVAAEIEHGLLIQYLYAAYSINGALPTAPDWTTKIKNIAIQEMDHLVNVQNMLFALKNDRFQSYFDRANFPVAPEHVGFYPFAFRLEPFSGDSLSKYVSAESPLPETICDSNLRSELEQIIARAERVSGMRTIGHVGNLYAYLYWLFLPSDAAADGPWPDFPANWFRRYRPGRHLSQADFADVSELDLRQADFMEFQANDGNAPNYPDNDIGKTHRWIFRVRSAADALRAIAQIAIQGEGTEMAADSHFLEFLGVYRDVEMLTPAQQQSVHLNVPTNPNLGQDPGTADGRIVNVATRLWALLCNTRYLMLLQELPLALSLRRDQDVEKTKRAILVKDAIQVEMKTGIRYLTIRLMGLPRADDPKEFAGPVFELPDDFLPTTVNEQWQELVRLIAVTCKLLAKIRALTGPGQPTTLDESRFKTLEDSDKAILQIVPVEFQPKSTRGNGTMPAQQLNSFPDLQAFFNKFITDNGTDLSGSPHGAFWNKDYNSFVNGDVPGVPGVKILIKGDADRSNLILILRGPLMLPGKTVQQMPSDGSPFMSPDLIGAVADWINRGCPQ